MSSRNVNSLLASYQYGAAQGIGRTQKATASKTIFAQLLQNTKASDVEAYTAYIKSRYGNVTIQNIDKSQKSMDALGSGTAGTGNVVIAPNILEQMANDPEKAAYYEGKINNYFNSVPRYEAELSAMGHEIHSSGIVIHPDGTVTHYLSGDLKPEVRARIEAQIKAEREEKANRKKQYQELNEEAAEKRRLLMQQHQKKQLVAEALQHQIHLADNIYIVGQTRDVAAVTAYENTASAFLNLSMAGRF